MWNNLACQSYDICSTRRITENQRKHLQQLTTSKSAIDTKKPWQPSHSLSKWTNKYTNQRNAKIQHDNQVLLEKMMFIDKQPTEMSQKKLGQHVHHIHSLAEYNRRKIQEELASENNKIIERIESATKKSSYGKDLLLQESRKFEQYRSNILRSKSKASGIDYTQLTKLNYPNEKFVIRKLSSPASSSSTNFFTSRANQNKEQRSESNNENDYQL